MINTVNNKYIGICGVATSGKDTLFKMIASEVKKKYNLNTIRFALADSLKDNMKEIIFEKYGIDVLNCSPLEKEKIRNELVSFARLMRKQTKGRYWVEKLNEKIIDYSNTSSYSKSDIFCITDIRYSQYEKDETYWLKTENKGILIYVEKIMPDGSVCIGPNNDERTNDPKLRKLSDYVVSWKHGDAKKNLNTEVKKCIDFLEKSDTFSLNERSN